ncbi:tectonin beta-propeller repeat-containing protein 1-like [Littorina saxatilis]|uniref:tectonin beta-propeller repeat-containing protein 1-like n=1 Tax=Littorina saxatilis TaxID=31220 RepID=UPI0038B4A247
MKDPRLWISNRNGNVFTVTASERNIKQLIRSYDGGVRVKRLAASDWCAWAVGHNHRVYTYVLPSDVPIRVPVTTYENQRWSPFSGYRSSNLLPTDRRAWSDERGDIYLPKENIRLPSAHWDWEGDWFIDENLQGEICTDTGGWQYAVNFTGKWTAQSCWNSCVRKRKWIRFCRYTATNTWALVSDMEVVEQSECFIDMTVGGQMLPGQPPGYLSVWAITNNGQVYVRTGVCRDCPEGEEWKHIVCDNMGIINIACGPTGLVWAITWDGHAFVRTHVSRDAIYGLRWESVPYPEEATRLMQVSVGRNSVWALSRDGKVWVRQGVNGDKLFWDAKAATGNSWVLMVGDMTHIAVSANDQVFALGQDDEDKEIWFRTGITSSEPGGKTWQRVVLEEDPDVFDINSPSCLMSRASQPSLDSVDDPFSMSDVFNLTQTNGLATLPRAEERSVPMTSMIESTSLPATLSAKAEDESISMFSLMTSSSLPAQILPAETPSKSDCEVDQAENSKSVDFCISDTEVSQTPVASRSVRKRYFVGHLSESLDSSTQYEMVDPAVLLTKPKKQTVSWQVIENSMKTSPRHEDHKPQDAEEAVESEPCISLIPCLPAARPKTKRSSLPTQRDSKKHAGKSSETTQSQAVYNGTGDVQTFQEQAEQDPSNDAELSTDLELNSFDEKQQINGLPSEEKTDASGALSSSFHSDNFDSLESNPSSDIICNFVTDIDDEEVAKEKEEEKEKEKTKKTKGSTKAGKNTECDNGRVTFQDMHDQSEPIDRDLSQPASIPWLSFGASETFTGRASLNTTPSSDLEVIPAMTLTLAQPRYAWGWIAAGDFMVENPSSVPWLSVSNNSESSVNFHLPKVSKAQRQNILQLLKQRNHKEIDSYSSYEHAIEKTTWVKKANMKLHWPDREGNCYDCLLEMEQGISYEMDGTLTIQFKFKHKMKVIQMSLQEMRCVKVCDDHHLAIYTSDPDTSINPFTLETSSEAELRDWMGTLSVANLSLWQLNRPIPAGSVCSLTIPGHIFVHFPDETKARPADMMWGQHGGHMASIETSPCGVIWAISFDQTPWVYNGGYGNAITRELSEMASNLREQVDYRTIRVFENQKWYPLVGYCSRGVFHNNFAWTTPKGKFVKSREDIKLPSSQWQWVSDWTVDFTTVGGVSNNGWQYATNFNRPYHPHQGMRDSVRRRQWSRKCKLVTQGPWVSVGPPEVIGISLQVDAPTDPGQSLVIWAIGANGDVLCRSEATLSQPMGRSWIHIATKSDMAFKSLSVGGGYRVWAVAADGSVWYRAGVHPHTPAGSCWIQVIPPPPGGATLHSISVGGSAVWAVDTGNNLWRREEITPTFPEGTRWSYVCNHVRKLSVGPKDQVWVVSEANFGRNKHSAGAVYRRLGITEVTPSGTDWELVIGPGWHYVSVRGLMTPNK